MSRTTPFGGPLRRVAVPTSARRPWTGVRPEPFGDPGGRFHERLSRKGSPGGGPRWGKGLREAAGKGISASPSVGRVTRSALRASAFPRRGRPCEYCRHPVLLLRPPPDQNRPMAGEGARSPSRPRGLAAVRPASVTYRARAGSLDPLTSTLDTSGLPWTRTAARQIIEGRSHTARRVISSFPGQTGLSRQRHNLRVPARTPPGEPVQKAYSTVTSLSEPPFT